MSWQYKILINILKNSSTDNLNVNLPCYYSCEKTNSKQTTPKTKTKTKTIPGLPMALYIVSPSPYPRDMDDFSLKVLHNTMFKSMKRRRKTLVCENLVLNFTLWSKIQGNLLYVLIYGDLPKFWSDNLRKKDCWHNNINRKDFSWLLEIHSGYEFLYTTWLPTMCTHCKEA